MKADKFRGLSGLAAMGRDKLPRDRCPHCRKPMPHDRDPKRIYCSKKCVWASSDKLKAEARRKARAGRRCKTCGKPFVAKQSGRVFCSIRCGVRFRRWKPLPGRHCLFCGGWFEAGRAAQKYCSVMCGVRFRRAAASPLGASARRPGPDMAP